ncbi:hypothetical protein GCM10023086_53590 [Streptomyces venetus]|uniref:Uncharacterized protein n=1 Tax=Streptomyces venetus TaxID=1701086 RepID=A0ABP8GKQ8_9ACTN
MLGPAARARAAPSGGTSPPYGGWRSGGVRGHRGEPGDQPTHPEPAEAAVRARARHEPTAPRYAPGRDTAVSRLRRSGRSARHPGKPHGGCLTAGRPGVKHSFAAGQRVLSHTTSSGACFT